ncbi:hypothetical protein [Flavihumibacter fluvii]|uniref:hypothetical protein n=1 Tax=Flavihumibacter fluvii TaxID=2838157 RepID=UPI001BDF59BE|nr:hypothetical protein [Flavihumibacter fluvii]ULQ52946.1 hypothetical protein KJS93_01280 [Flavihumibacter fluvii]
MDPINIQMIIDGCLVNNQQARALLFHQVYSIGLPVAWSYSENEAAADDIIEKAFLYILDNLSFYDGTKLGFKSWVKQVVIDKGVEQQPLIGRTVYVLHAVEGFNQHDISKRLKIPEAEVGRLFAEVSGSKQEAVEDHGMRAADPDRQAAAWSRLSPVILERFSSDESEAMPVRAMAKQRVANGGWIGWAVLICLSALAMLVLHQTGVVKGGKIQANEPPVRHVSIGLGYALPCPNH